MPSRVDGDRPAGSVRDHRRPPAAVGNFPVECRRRTLRLLLSVAVAGELQRHNGVVAVGQQLVRGAALPFKVQRDRNPGRPCQARGAQGRLRLEVVHVQHARPAHDALGDTARRRSRPVLRRAEDRPRARRAVRKDHGYYYRTAGHPRNEAGVHPLALELPDAELAEGIIAEGAQVSRPSAQPRDGHQGRPHQAASLRQDTRLAGLLVLLRQAVHLDHYVEGADADSDYVIVRAHGFLPNVCYSRQVS